mmetsp:Transcript_13871/g.27958  ORF Transcript_13871/g.27958 Transcript_13871/m.27958 type:complete len:187 (-) Transcript_13871:139-699(-)
MWQQSEESKESLLREEESSQQQSESKQKTSFQKSLNFYIAIEGTWHVALFTACYRYRPLLKLSRTTGGRRMIDKVQSLIHKRQQSNTSGSPGKWQEYFQSAATRYRIPGGRHSLVAASEWFFFNKVIGIPLLPTKLLLAKWMSQKWDAHKHDLLPEWWWAYRRDLDDWDTFCFQKNHGEEETEDST